MTEILPSNAPRPVSVLGWDGTRFRVFTLDAAGQLQIDVLSNANLDGALQSVGTDRLQVRGEDQLFTINDFVEEFLWSQNAAGNTEVVTGALVPAGLVWIVTGIRAWNMDGPCDDISLWFNLGAGNRTIKFGILPLEDEHVEWDGLLNVPAGGNLSAYFRGIAVNDRVYLNYWGYSMTREV